MTDNAITELSEEEVAELHGHVGGLLRSWGVHGDKALADTFLVVWQAVQNERLIEKHRTATLRVV